jgi:hypothetical protein
VIRSWSLIRQFGASSAPVRRQFGASSASDISSTLGMHPSTLTGIVLDAIGARSRDGPSHRRAC